MDTQTQPLPFDEAAMQDVRQKRLLIDQYDTWLYEEYEPFVGKRILEIGCGLGNQILHFCDRELVIGIDISPPCIEEVSQRFEGCGNIEFHCMDITGFDTLALRDRNLDTVISLNVFEHLRDDQAAFQRASQILKPGGKFIVIVPAHQSLYGALDAAIGHYRRYSKHDLRRRKLAQAGMAVLAEKYINILGALGWMVNGKVLRRRAPHSGQLRLFNALVPFLRKLERRFNPPIGISLLAVAEKAQ